MKQNRKLFLKQLGSGLMVAGLPGWHLLMINQSSLKVAASKRISIVLNWNYQYDDLPAAGITTDTYNLSTGVEVGFK